MNNDDDDDEVLRAVAYAQSFFINRKPRIIIRQGVSDTETKSIIAIDGTSFVFPSSSSEAGNESTKRDNEDIDWCLPL